ncbi:MAG: N-acetyltransferase [Firmicutes bacterium]|nr:N-acetyltransferase [Alicyclobacillaceae bacterium]MCL6497126.1 N-acetyltransferase [Bacillota bacterium]
MRIRSAVMADIDAIYALIEAQARRGILLPRSRASLCEHIQSLSVAEGEGGRVVGVVALHVLDRDLAEVRSLAVADDHQGRGIGRALVEHAVRRAAALGIHRVLSLTVQVEFFRKCGFQPAQRLAFPQKVWKDCLNCPKLAACDEVAMQIDAVAWVQAQDLREPSCAQAKTALGG